jgi:peptide/nickel transport system permease protein
MREEFITMARMKGLSERRIMLRHAARNALLPLVTAFAITFGQLIGSNVVIETVFSWPGLGRMLVDAVANSDYPMAQGAFLLIAAILVVMNFVADLVYGFLDPRVTHDGG